MPQLVIWSLMFQRWERCHLGIFDQIDHRQSLMLLELAGEFCALLDGLFFCTIVIFFSEMLVSLAFSLCSRSFGCRMYSISQWFGGIILLHSGVTRDGWHPR
jgi:hypothetical protein